MQKFDNPSLVYLRKSQLLCSKIIVQICKRYLSSKQPKKSFATIFPLYPGLILEKSFLTMCQKWCMQVRDFGNVKACLCCLLFGRQLQTSVKATRIRHSRQASCHAENCLATRLLSFCKQYALDQAVEKVHTRTLQNVK